MLFFVLALLHVYWAIGGSWAKNLVIPVNSNGRKIFKPQSVSTFFVAIILLLCTMVDLSYCGLIMGDSRNQYTRFAISFIALLFLLRAIGDFRYIGFFKKYKNAPFAKIDYIIFSPLCLFIAMSHALAYWTKESPF